MIYPSIDLMNGKVVQLVQGKKEQKKIEIENPLEQAEKFSKYQIQVIDLDAAMGNGDNLTIIKELCGRYNCRVGGGIRILEKAEEIMTPNIISVKPDEDIKATIKKMKQNDISQLPVIEDHKSIGIVSEAILLEAFMDNKGKKIKDIMQDSPPVISKNTSIDVISNLLRFSPLLLVSEGGKLIGLITKSDLLGAMYKG